MHRFMSEGGDGYGCFKDCEMQEHYIEKINLQLIVDLINLNKYLLNSYLDKYPQRYVII
jgi:hypothetical protein